MAAAKCKECGRRPKAPGRHRCVTCQLRHEPIGEQVAAARRRLAMVPEDLRVKRVKAIVSQSPAGTTWCAGCQSFRDLEDFAKGATTCRACVSARSHASNVEKVYGISGDDYEALLRRQGGKCAICRARPRSKRLAVDHDHATGTVRGLLCGRCNHDLMGASWDSLAIATALWHYLNTPPASGDWVPPETQPQLAPVENATRRSDGLDGDEAIVTRHGGRSTSRGNVAPGACERPHVIPVGSESVPGKHGVWRYWSEPDGDTPF